MVKGAGPRIYGGKGMQRADDLSLVSWPEERAMTAYIRPTRTYEIKQHGRSL